LATLTRPKRRKTTLRSSTASPVVPKTRLIQEVEAPDRGDQSLKREAPESPKQRGRLAATEAPDAGEGRVTALDQDFTHGRSQS
jgi:hypothetical protein